MKKVKPETKSIDMTWLPPAEEWDFRSVAPGECRVACHWEYERENHPVTSNPVQYCEADAAAKHPVSATVQGGVTQKYFPATYRQAARELFPQAWTTLTKEQREKILESFLPAPVIQVRKLGEFFKRMPVGNKNWELTQAILKNCYVVIPNFRVHGVEAVIKEFEKWARKEAKQHPQSRRAQAAELPFDALKWLAVARLDKVRCQARITIERARETVLAYQQANRRHALNDSFPAYASDGAWLKAKKNALDCQAKSKTNPSYLLAELA